MSRPKRLVSNGECARFNTLRQGYSGQTLKRSKIEELIKFELGWKQAPIIQRLIQKVFVRVDRGLYMFPKDPVYIVKLQGIFDSVSAQYKVYKQNTKKEELSDIQKAINLSKANGYKIIKESFDVERALQNPTRTVGDFISIQEF